MNLSFEEQRQLIERIKKGDKKAAEVLLKAYTPLIRTLAQKYARDSNYEDLLQEGYIGLLQAAKNFNTNLGVSFVTLAFYWVQRNMSRYILKNSSVKISTHMRLSDIPAVASLDAPVEADEGKKICLGDTLHGDDSVEREVEFKVMLEKVVEVLNEEEKKVLLLRIQGYTFKQIAEKLGITERQLSFRLKKMRTKLQRLIKAS
ncbi:sigma-70 family RNA polymerase sigma factor [Anaerocellum danielii]|uniref:Sigma-70 family RNA polymerase sigma factor n=1 Tax=Anaerocellum danielii TaxID=1387557 RepID=A0ABZ0TY25_9FIRM|nr:sigma-70 family RNA polymerase sigma factor [Caldicellulosiruptor danielii]WPX08134.1 sigma-70 family RNA polymerase sigma factor [Caldicellulosiruptor danielii]